MFLQASFQGASVSDRVIRSYLRAHGEWPTKPDMTKLIRHIKGSFVLASTIFKFIIQPATEDDSSTPMDRLPLALEMHGLDDLCAGPPVRFGEEDLEARRERERVLGVQRVCAPRVLLARRERAVAPAARGHGAGPVVVAVDGGGGAQERMRHRR